MGNVKVVKFMSGQEVIAKVSSGENDVIVLESPLTLQPMRNADNMQIGLLPFSWGGVSESVLINLSHVLCVLEAEESLATSYLSSLSGISLPSPKLTLVE